MCLQRLHLICTLPLPFANNFFATRTTHIAIWHFAFTPFLLQCRCFAKQGGLEVNAGAFCLAGAVVLVTPPRRRPSYWLKVIVLSDDKPLTAIISEMHCYMQFHNLFQH